MRHIVSACLLLLIAGCRAPGYRSESQGVEAYRAASPARPPLGVVFVANGAGDFRTVSRNLSQVVAETSAPLQIETFVWSRGYRRYLADQVDHTNHLVRAAELAGQVTAYRRCYGERRIYLMGHSAGCAVVLAAGDLLPADSVDRIILLAPSVCTAYDLRPALRAARGGIDVFHSNEDRFILGLGMRLFGTAERNCRTAAGQTGFMPIVDCPTDAALYGKLRQHGWDQAVEWSGHNGGHFGNNEPGFLRAYVLPLLLCE